MDFMILRYYNEVIGLKFKNSIRYKLCLTNVVTIPTMTNTFVGMISLKSIRQTLQMFQNRFENLKIQTDENEKNQ